MKTPKINAAAAPVILYLVLAAAIGYILYQLFGKKQPGEQDQVNALKDIQDEIKNYSRRMPPSYSDSWYTQQAQIIWEAGRDIGTDENAIFGVFRKLKNTTDLLKLILAFGLKPGDFTTDPLEMQKLNLSAWLRTEFDTAEIAKIQAILTKNRIGRKI